MDLTRHRRNDGVVLPAYAAGLAAANSGSNGGGLLEPTQVLTPNTSMQTATENNEEEQTSEINSHSSNISFAEHGMDVVSCNPTAPSSGLRDKPNLVGISASKIFL